MAWSCHQGSSARSSVPLLVGKLPNMPGADGFLALIEKRLSEKAITAAEASRLASGHPYLIYDLRKGVNPRYDTIERLCRVLDIEFHVGLAREKSKREPPALPAEIPESLGLPATATVSEAVKMIDALNANEPVLGRLRNEIASFRATLGETLSRIPEPPRVIKFPSGQGRAVPVRELQSAAGGGALDLDETVTGHVYFRTQWLKKHGLNPDRCSVIGVIGESMEPTLVDGCSILLDHDRRQLRAGGIFVVRAPDGLIVKRARKVESGEWLLASDNPAWGPAPWPTDADIVGQVMWTARTLI